MIDVHPPEHTPHTWHDFFIHIATIVLGLVIAIGLEQTVEWVQHQHERRQLQHDLVTEAKNNLDLMKLDYAYFDKTGPELAALRSQARTLRAHPASGPQTADLSPITGINNIYFADAPVWNTAKEGGLIVLLPRREAALYDLVYGQQSLMAAEFHRYEQDRAVLTNFCLRFTADPSKRLNLTNLSPEELQEYNVLLANLQGEIVYFRHETDYAQAVTLQAARGETGDQQAFEEIGVASRH